MHSPIMKLIRKILPWIFVVLFIIFYPMLISIYVFIPLMIGFMSYILLLGIEQMRIPYIVISLVYLINLEVNLSLPLFLTTAVTILFYLTLYPKLDLLKKCKVCVPLLSVIFIDLLYVIFLLGYDFIFGEISVVLDKLLIYSLVADILMVFLL